MRFWQGWFLYPLTASLALAFVGVGLTGPQREPDPVAQHTDRRDRAPSPPLPLPAPPDQRTLTILGREARAAVAAESPSDVFPFALGRTGQGGTLIVAHYFPPFPVSLDNKAAAEDYYAGNYLRAEGEGGKFARQGGFLRDRPLAAPVRPNGLRVVANLALEVARAERIGIDAFGVDLLGIGKGRTWDAAVLLLDAARAVSPAFRIIPEPDMTANPSLDVSGLADALLIFARHPSAYRTEDGRLLVMPFMAERRPPEFWRALTVEMQRRGAPIALAPVYLSPGGIAPAAATSWGASIWGDRDVTAFRRSEAAQARAQENGVRRWFHPVATQDYRPKASNFWEARNTEAFRTQWEGAIAGGGKRVHLITWNDYSESSHLAPSAVTQFAFYDLAAYYIAWLKRGASPPIRKDALYVVHRRQILSGEPNGPGPALARKGVTPLADEVELVALLTQPGVLRLRSGERTVTRQVGPGLQTLRAPAAAGEPRFALLREGRVVAGGTSPWTIDPRPTRKDATYAGASTTRPFRETPGID